jgi:hypothetical protein
MRSARIEFAVGSQTPQGLNTAENNENDMQQATNEDS